MKNIKRLLSVLMALVVTVSCLSLAGCGDSKTAKKKNSDAQLTSDDPYAGIEEYEGTTLKFATWIDHTKSEAARVFSSFEEKYGIKIELVSVSQSDYVTKVAGLVASEASPDIIVNNSKTPSIFSLLQPLNDVSTVNLEDDFWDKDILELNKIHDNYYLVNSKNSPQNYRSLVTYNKKLFEDNGFKSPGEYYEEGNWTIETMEECATRIARLGSDYVGISIMPDGVADIFGTNMITYKNGQYKNNCSDPTLQKAYKWAMGLKEKGIYTSNYMWWKFNKNLVGMEVTSDWQLRANGSYAKNGVDPDVVDYVPLPKLSKDAKQISTLGNRGYGICKGSKNVEAAGYFLRYFLDYENYNEDEMFQSKKAAKMFKMLREIECETLFNLEKSCLASYYGETIDYDCYKMIFASTSAQFSVNLKKFTTEMQAVVDSCNETLEEIE